MPPVDVKALRELAERATPGPWLADEYRDDERGAAIIASAREAAIGNPSRGMVAWASALGAVSFDDCKSVEANAAFIAAANPSTVLALLADNEVKGKALREIADYRPPSSFEDPYQLIAIFSKKTARAALSPATPTPETNDAG